MATLTFSPWRECAGDYLVKVNGAESDWIITTEGRLFRIKNRKTGEYVGPFVKHDPIWGAIADWPAAGEAILARS